jgi:hypothetical protein
MSIGSEIYPFDTKVAHVKKNKINTEILPNPTSNKAKENITTMNVILFNIKITVVVKLIARIFCIRMLLKNIVTFVCM